GDDMGPGGTSANLGWAFDAGDTGRINALRRGESILLGREPLRRRPIDGLHRDAITLVAEVIESNVKPSRPWGTIAETAFGALPPGADRGDVSQVIFALGHQDVDPGGLHPPPGIELLGASSDHLVAASVRDRLAIGAETRFELDYSALLRAMTSPFVARNIRSPAAAGPRVGPRQALRHSARLRGRAVSAGIPGRLATRRRTLR
ncbi:MAG: hypothetical protein OXG35_16420, partial [Acidobacteria bacterium]|nr:hypothetical protein [Acidobacteriota bacterium]